jgi:hypothetical protein
LVIDDRLSLSVTHADQSVTRWGPDEPNAEDVPGDLTFSTSIPGGYRDLSCSLLRRIDLDYPDQGLYDGVTVYGPGNVTAWDGRLIQFPRSHGAGFEITPGAVGWSAHLKDDPSFREIYIDRDVSHWTDAPFDRMLERANAGFAQGKIQLTIGNGGAIWTVPNEALPSGEHSELHYDAGPGLGVAMLLYNGTRTGASWAGSFEAPTVFIDTAATFPSASSATLTLDGASRTASGWTTERYAMVRTRTTAAVTPAVGHQQSYASLVAIGGHGLTTSTAGTGSTGFLASDVLANILTRAAPALSYTTGTDGSIETTAFAIPHLVFHDPITAEDAIMFVNAYHQYEWGVYDNREFFYRAPDPDRLCWEARLSEGAHVQLEGDTAEQVFNGIVVSYQDVNGQRKSIGPAAEYWHAGTALVDATSTLLVDTSETNPLNEHGLTRWAKLEISQPTTQAGAEQLGYVWLTEHSLPQRRGNITLTGTATHPTEGQVPVWRPRAGDYVRIPDHPADVPRRIISTSYTHGSRSISLDCDNTSFKLDAIMERLGVGLVGVL